MSHSLNVTVMVDAGTISPDDPEFTAEPQTTTEGHVVAALRELGHRVGVLGVDDCLAEIVGSLTEHPPDIVFNLAEQFRNDRRLDMNVPALLEMMDVRFTGTGPAGLMLCRDKGLCKQLLSLHKIRVPDFLVLEPGQSIRVPKRIQYPVLVKPLYEDASDGIAMASLVKNESELLERARFVHERWDQVAIAEQYIEGRELYVSVLGNDRLTVFPPREIRFGNAGKGGPIIATSRVKWNEQYRQKWNIEYGFAELPEAVFAKVARVCKRVYRLLQLRDYGRIDLRLTPEGRIFILEVNPNPGIAYGEDYAESAEKAGVGYNRLIDRILRLALRRYEPAPIAAHVKTPRTSAAANVAGV